MAVKLEHPHCGPEQTPRIRWTYAPVLDSSGELKQLSSIDHQSTDLGEERHILIRANKRCSTSVWIGLHKLIDHIPPATRGLTGPQHEELCESAELVQII